MDQEANFQYPLCRAQVYDIYAFRAALQSARCVIRGLRIPCLIKITICIDAEVLIVNPSMVAVADLEHLVDKIYKCSHGINDNIKIEVIHPLHYSSPLEYNLYAYYICSSN